MAALEEMKMCNAVYAVFCEAVGTLLPSLPKARGITPWFLISVSNA